LQKEAFEALQIQKDARHQRIAGQIELIEQELAQLTALEVEHRQLSDDLQKVFPIA
jgi:E3 ubiquitin-protein ligase LRSAM1